MNYREQMEDAVNSIDRRKLKDIQVGDSFKQKASNGRFVEFTVSAIKKGQRGWAISLRTPEGYEWVVPGIRWIQPGD